jgi:ferredoxin, 2Fe-2S
MNSKLTVGSLIPNASMPIQEQPKPKVILREKSNRLDTIGILQNNLTFRVYPITGKLLLDAALEQGQKINYKCKKGTCGVCMVKIGEGEPLLCPANQKEHKKLNNNLNLSYRLACQAIIK